MGDTFRRISMTQRRKKSSVMNEFRARKKSAFAPNENLKIESDELDNYGNVKGWKTSKVGRIYELEDNMKFGRETLAKDVKRQRDIYLDIEVKDRIPQERKIGAVCWQEHRRNDRERFELLCHIFQWLKNVLDKNEHLIQALIFLPIILTALYIVFVEKGPLMLWRKG